VSNHFNIKIGNKADFKGYCYTGGICDTNGYAFETAEGWILIDAPEGFIDFIKPYNIDVKLLMLTHQHFDHVLDAGKISSHFKCPIWAFDNYDKKLTLESLFEFESGPQITVSPYEISEKLGETDKDKPISALGVPFEVFHVPGHSPDSICFYLKESGILFGGDVLFRESIGRTDFPDGDTNQLIEGIRNKIFTLEESVIVLPGHGSETTVGDEKSNNPFLI